MTGRNEKLIIGQRLRVLRQSLGLTQAQMAAELGVSASYVTLIEADQRRNAQQIEDHKCHKNTPNGGMLPPVF